MATIQLQLSADQEAAVTHYKSNEQSREAFVQQSLDRALSGFVDGLQAPTREALVGKFARMTQTERDEVLDKAREFVPDPEPAEEPEGEGVRAGGGGRE